MVLASIQSPTPAEALREVPACPANLHVAIRNSPTTVPGLSVVIVNYCQWDNTVALVKQLLPSRIMRRQVGEVLIVDNHSPPHPAARRLRRWRGVSLRRWGRNRGFAIAVNEGCRLSRGDWILLLNPDMSLPAGFLDRVAALTEQLDRDEPRSGIVGLGLQNADGSRQLSAGSFPSFFGTLARLLVPRSRRKFPGSPGRQRCRVDWVTGCAMLIRRDCLRELGGLDPDFFLYYEDVDLCRRARVRGWEVRYVPEIEAVHHQPLHLRRVAPSLRLVTRHSLLTYARKHWPGWQFQMLAAIVRLEAWARRLWANWRGDRQARKMFTELGQLVQQLKCNNPEAARRRLRRLTQRQWFYTEA